MPASPPAGTKTFTTAPTGFSAIVTPEGEVLDRTAISEQAVVHGTVELREGDTWATTVGHWPMLFLALLSYPLAWWVQRRSEPARDDRPNRSRAA